MPHSLDQLLPSLEALGILAYWLIGLASALEAFFLTGVVVPGTLIVDAGGILVQRGLLDFFDLVWFVAIGSVLGSQMSYWTGRLAMHRVPGRRRIEASAAFVRAEVLFKRRGGAALVIGRFLGPLSGLVPLVAGMAGMERRHFLIWNLAGSVPYALVHVSIGYLLGDALGRLGGTLTRVAVLAGAVALLLAVLWGLLYTLLRLAPLALAIVSVALHGLAARPPMRRVIDRHPEAVRWLVARGDRSSFAGLPLSGLTLVFLYVAGMWLDSAVDFLTGDPMVALDLRLAELLHHFQTQGAARIAAWVTALGDWTVVVPLVAASLLWLVVTGRRPLAAGLLVAVLGNTIAVALLKIAFARPRSALGWFVETSGSFPSGHAAASVAVYGMLAYVLWRAGTLRAETALLGAGLVAFAIGVSRVYLIEHYMSDVLNGWLVGLLWVIVGVAVAEWRAARLGAAPVAQVEGLRRAAAAASVALVLLAAANVWRYDHPRNVAAGSADIVLSGPGDVADVADLQGATESLLGSPLQPVSVVVFARDEAALAAAMRAAGWAASRPPGAGAVLVSLLPWVEDRADPSVATLPHFWRGVPNDLAFVRPDGVPEAASGASLEARFWRTDMVMPDGRRAFVGAVGVQGGDEGTAEAPDPSDRTTGDAIVHALLGRHATLVSPVPSGPAAESQSGAGSTTRVPVLVLP